MILSADEIGRSLAGSYRLMSRDATGMKEFEISIAGFWRSFAAILLTAPAFVIALAEDRLRAGLPLEAGLFADGGIVATQIAALLGGWLVFPLAMIAIVRRLGLGHRYIGYIVAWNWSVVLATMMLSVPQALHVLGLATTSLAVVYAIAFMVIVAHHRWFLAKAALGISGGLAGLLVLVDLGLSGVVGLSLSYL